MPPKKKRITPTLIGPVGSTTKKGKKKLVPGKKRLKQRVKSKPKAKKTKRKTKTNDQIAVKLLTHMCSKCAKQVWEFGYVLSCTATSD